MKKRSNVSRPKPAHAEPTAIIAPPRIVGGTMRGRKLQFSGDERTRPMKDRVREALFNLVGTETKGKHALDLFAGTGALGFEALSRGAERATFVERHFPTAELLKRSAAELEVTARTTVHGADTFIWAKRFLPTDGPPWLVFVSPPWSLFVERNESMLELIGDLVERCPAESIIVVEADQAFDLTTLPQADAWKAREYLPAVVAIYRRQ